MQKIKILKILIAKISFVFIIFFITSCSYLTPKSVNEYSVTRKSPLVIPPDMNMVPPNKKIKKKIYKKKLGYKNEGFNLDEILIGETKNNRTMSKKNKKSRNKKKLDLVKTILKMKEITTLK